MNNNFVIRTKQTKEGSIVPSKVWITFLNNGFEKHWLPLMHFVDGVEQQMVWSTDDIGTNPMIKRTAAENFPHLKWGLADCEQKELGNACIDNF
jgi:hypothetical protein